MQVTENSSSEFRVKEIDCNGAMNSSAGVAPEVNWKEYKFRAEVTNVLQKGPASSKNSKRKSQQLFVSKWDRIGYLLLQWLV